MSLELRLATRVFIEESSLDRLLNEALRLSISDSWFTSLQWGQKNLVRRSRPMKTTRFRSPRALSSVLAALGHYQGTRPFKSRSFHGFDVLS